MKLTLEQLTRKQAQDIIKNSKLQIISSKTEANGLVTIEWGRIHDGVPDVDIISEINFLHDKEEHSLYVAE